MKFFQRPVLYIFCLLLLLHLITSFFKTSILWGVDSWRYYPSHLIALFFLTGFLLFLFTSFGWMKKIGENLLSQILQFVKARSFRVWSGILTICCMGLFWLAKTKTFFLGDGYLRARNIEIGLMFSVEEPLDTFIHAAFYRTLGEYFSLSGADIYSLVSILCGGIFIFIVLVMVRSMPFTLLDKIFFFSALLFTGTIQLFCGYVESYSIAAVCLMAYYYSALHSVTNPRYLYFSSTVLGFSICVHPTSILLIPSFFYLWLVSRKDANMKSSLALLSKIVLFFLIPIIGTISLFYYGGRFSLGELFEIYFRESNILPLKSPEVPLFVSYSMFSPLHILDIINEYFLIAPVSAVVFYVFIRWIFKKDLIIHYEIVFFGLISLSYFIFLLVFDMKKGAARDWDLFAPAAIPLTLLIMFIVLKTPDFRKRGICIMIIGYSIVHTVPWIGVNASTQLSLNRIKYLLDNSHWNYHSTADGYDELSSYYHHRSEFEMANEYAKLAYQTLQSDRYRENYASSLVNVGSALAIKGNYSEAIPYFQKAMVIDSLNMESYYNLGLSYQLIGNLSEAARMYSIFSDMKQKQISGLRLLTISVQFLRTWDI